MLQDPGEQHDSISFGQCGVRCFCLIRIPSDVTAVQPGKNQSRLLANHTPHGRDCPGNLVMIINFVIYAALASPPARLDCRLGLDAPFVVSAEDVAQYT
jgi:hypothetical protein